MTGSCSAPSVPGPAKTTFTSSWLPVSMQLTSFSVLFLPASHRRRINTEEKAKVVAAVWGIELIQFLAGLVVFSQGQFEE